MQIFQINFFVRFTNNLLILCMHNMRQQRDHHHHQHRQHDQQTRHHHKNVVSMRIARVQMRRLVHTYWLLLAVLSHNLAATWTFGVFDFNAHAERLLMTAINGGRKKYNSLAAFERFVVVRSKSKFFCNEAASVGAVPCDLSKIYDYASHKRPLEGMIKRLCVRKMREKRRNQIATPREFCREENQLFKDLI